MREKPFLVLLITILIGIQPMFAQSKSDSPAKPAAPEKTVREEENIIHISQASDSEFTQALQTANDVELVNEDSVKTEKSDKAPNQGKAR